MNKILKLITSLFFVVIISNGCAVKQVQKFQEVDNFRKDKSLVYLYWIGGRSITTINKLDRDYPKMQKNTFFSKIVDPGTHEVASYRMIGAGNVTIQEELARLTFETKPGEIYFIKIESKSTFSGNLDTGDISISIVDSETGLNDIRSCSLVEELYYGLIENAAGYLDTSSEDHHNKAVVKIYRDSKNLYNSAIGAINVGIYSKGGSGMVGVTIDSCESYTTHVDSGLVQLVEGNMVLSGAGKALFSTITNNFQDIPDKRFLAIETGLGGHQASWDFMAEPGKTYYIDIDPHHGFNFLSPNEISDLCDKDQATVVTKKDTSFLDEFHLPDTTIDVFWVRKKLATTAGLYSKVYHAGGILDYLSVLDVSIEKNRNIRDKIYSITMDNDFSSILFEKFNFALKKYNKTVPQLSHPIMKEDISSYKDIVKDKDSDFSYIFEVFFYGVSQQYFGMFPFISSSSKPTMIVSGMGRVFNNRTQTELFRKPYNALQTLTKDNDVYSREDYEKLLKSLLINISEQFLMDAT